MMLDSEVVGIKIFDIFSIDILDRKADFCLTRRPTTSFSLLKEEVLSETSYVFGYVERRSLRLTYYLC